MKNLSIFFIFILSLLPGLGRAQGLVLTVDPTNQSVIVDSTAYFFTDLNTNGFCGGNFSYQWQHNGTDIVSLITIIAGNGVGGYSGNGGQATSAELNDPNAIFINNVGTLYIADAANNVIRSVDTNGIITTVAGGGSGGGSDSLGDGGAATNAVFNNCLSLSGDTNGNLYVCDQYDNLVRRVDASGVITIFAGGGAGGGPDGLGDGGAATDAILNNPTGLAVDSSGNVYISDHGDALVREVDTNGNITIVAGNYLVGAGYGGDSFAASDAELNQPNGLAVDASENLYIADSGNDVIRKVDTNGVISTVAGSIIHSGTYSGDGGVATNAGLNFPNDVGVDFLGNLYIADFRNNVVRKVDVDGIISTVAGTGTGGDSGNGGVATNATMLAPAGVALNVDALGDLYIADAGNDVVHKVSNVLMQDGLLDLDNVTTNDVGAYQAILSSACGSITSSVAYLTVLNTNGLPYPTPAATLNVANYGAVGNAEQVWVYTTSNSFTVGFTNTINTSLIGDTIEIFGVGDIATNGAYADLIGIITNVSGTNAYIRIPTNYVGGAWQYGGDTPQVTISGVNIIPGDATYNSSGQYSFFVQAYYRNYRWTPGANDTGIDNGSLNVLTNAAGNVTISTTNAILVGTPNATVTATVIQNMAYCIFGTNNVVPINNCIKDGYNWILNGTNPVVTIPAGMVSPWGTTNAYLCIPYKNYTNYNFSSANDCTCFILTNGGFDFEGVGRGQTIIMAGGAWTIKSFQAIRSTLFAVNSSPFNSTVNTNLPLSFRNMTMDGGVVPYALVGNQGDQAPAAGFFLGGNFWDGSSRAFENDIGGNPPFVRYTVFGNVIFQHFMGEVLYGSPEDPCRMTVTNFQFYDCNADCMNVEYGYTMVNGDMTNVDQPVEFFTENVGTEFPNAPATNDACFVGNITIEGVFNGFGGSLFALTGGTAINPPYVISNVVVNLTGSTFVGNIVQVNPMANVTVEDFLFIGGGNPTAFLLGGSGGQPQAGAWNSNILIFNGVLSNNFANSFTGGGPFGGGDANAIYGGFISNNILKNPGAQTVFAQFGWNTNFVVTGNECFGQKMGAGVNLPTSPYPFISTNNDYWIYVDEAGDFGPTNAISYGASSQSYLSGGSKYLFQYSPAAQMTNWLTVADANQIPPGAAVEFTNTSPVAVKVYLDGPNFTGPSISISSGQSAVVYFNPAVPQWQTTHP